MPLKTDKFWKERIKSIKSNHPEWGAGRITRQLRAEGKQLGRNDIPSDRTVGRVLRKEWDVLSEADRALYRDFYWPESMEREALPWEASESALEILHFLESGGLLSERPPVRLVQWFWRVSQAGSGGGLTGRVAAAVALTINDLTGDRPGVVPVRGVEWWLAYRPWEGEAQLKAYRKAISRAVNPIPRMEGTFTMLESENEPGLRELMEWLFGKSLEGTRAVFGWTMMDEDVDSKIMRSEDSNG